MAMYEQRSAYENLTRFNFIGAGEYDIPVIYNNNAKPEKFIGFNKVIVSVMKDMLR